MASDSYSVARSRLLLFGWWIVFYASFTLWLPPLFDDADSVHAEVAREMILRHDWVTLYANGIRYLEKAPLLYWSMAASFRVFGVSTAAARVPLALSVLGLALAVEAFARRAFESARAGRYAGMILLSSFGIFIFTRITIPDAGVCLWLTLALYAFWLTEREQAVNRWACWAFAVCCSLNVLTKGLIGIVFPVGIVAIYLLLTRGAIGAVKRVWRLYPASSVLVFLAVAAPWHVLAGLANPTQGHPLPVVLHGSWWVKDHWIVSDPTDGNVHGWFWFYFVNEHLLRYLGLRTPKDYDTVPLGLFYGLCIAWLLPWSGYVVPALGRAVGGLRKLRVSLAARTNLLLLLWAFVPLAFFSLSTRQEYYVLPALPALMILIAGWMAAEKPYGLAGRVIAGWMAAIGAAGSAFALYLVARSHAAPAGTELADLLQQNPGDYALSFGHFLDLNVPSMGLFRMPLIVTVVALLGGTMGNWRMRRRGRPHAANLALMGGAALLLVASHLGLRTFAPVLSSARLADAIRPQLRPGDLIVIHGEYEAGSTLGFYLGRNDLHLWDGRSSNLWYGSFFTDAPKIFETRQSIEARWREPQRVFLWQDPSDKDRPLPQLPGAIYLIAQSGGKQILSNQPKPGVRQGGPIDFDDDDPGLTPIGFGRQ